jgi:DNA-binding transcriptional MerR regulator
VADQPLTIGQMSRLSGLTVKALRYYERVGLIQPAAVDAQTGFRYYAPDQVAPARLIRALRSVDLPLGEVRRCLDDPAGRAGILHAHRTRLESRAARLAGELHDLYHLLDDLQEPIMTDHAEPGPPADLMAAGLTPAESATAAPMTAEDERRLAARLFNGVWDLLEAEDRGPADDDRMLHMAHASRYHWGQVGTPERLARGEWQCSRVYAALRRAEPCLHHAQRVLDICQAEGIGDFDLAFAFEALARGHATAGDAAAARAMTDRCLAAAAGIADEEDRKIVLADLETIPGQPRFW